MEKSGNRQPSPILEAGRTNTKPGKKVFRANRVQIGLIQEYFFESGLLAEYEPGKMGQETRKALKAFQKKERLKPTGTINLATFEKLSPFIYPASLEPAEVFPERVFYRPMVSSRNNKASALPLEFEAILRRSSLGFAFFDRKTDGLMIGLLFLLLALFLVSSVTLL